MIVQIYEITSLEEAKKMTKIGVDHIGFLVGRGECPRELTIKKAAMIFRSLPLGARKVALSLSSDLQDIFEIIDRLRPDVLHLGADEHKLPLNKVKTIRKKYPELKIMRTIAVINEDSIELAKKYEEISDYLLLDTYKSQLGATGEVHDWNISKKIVESVRTPVILAGGLGPDNVKEAIRKVSPAGVDSKTKTDQGNTHRKDIEKVKKFVSVVKSFE